LLKFFFNATRHDHTSLKIQKAITKLGWTVLPHPPQGPDLAPSDCHLFGAIRGKRFASDDEVVQDVKKSLRVQNSHWYKKGIDDLASR
jgi:hypothetical protein